MKILKYTLIIVVSLILAVLLLSFLLPSTVHVERSLEVKAKPIQAFKLVNQLRNWQKWSPWCQMDTTAKIDYSEIDSGKGAYFNWSSKHKQVGDGSLTIAESKPDSMIDILLQFGNTGASHAHFTFVPTATGTKITWSLDNDAASMPWYLRPMSKIFFTMMDKMVGADFEKGLANMKQVLESNPSLMVGNFEAEVRDFAGMRFIGIRSKLRGDEIGPKLGEYYGILQAEIKNNHSTMVGAPFTINYAASGNVYDMQAALGVADSIMPKAPAMYGNLKPSKWLVVKYYGNYEEMSPVYQKGFEFLAQNNWKPSGAPMEFYITDPQTEKDPAKWLTELAFPFFE